MQVLDDYGMCRHLLTHRVLLGVLWEVHGHAEHLASGVDVRHRCVVQGVDFFLVEVLGFGHGCVGLVAFRHINNTIDWANAIDALSVCIERFMHLFVPFN